MRSSACVKARYEWLDEYARIVEQSLPIVRAVAFFDTRGNALRGRGPVPLLDTGPKVREALQLAAKPAGRAAELIFQIGRAECAAVLPLYAEELGHRGQRGAPVAGACLIIFGVPEGRPPPTLDSFHAVLDAALGGLGHLLAECARQSPP